MYEYSNGVLFYTAGRQDGALVPASQIPSVTAHVVVSIENPTLYTDEGFSPRGILRAQ